MNKAIDLYLTVLRNKKTKRCSFQKNANLISEILAQQTLLHIQTKQVHIETPIDATEGIERCDDVMLVPILRSGITMLPAFLKFFPGASIGVMGLQRDEKTAQAHWYYHKLPTITSNQQIIIIDPMIATGGTGIETIGFLKKEGIPEDKMLFVSIISAPEGINAITEKYPHVTIISAGKDKELNKKKFIVPGLGDFGDRYFGTEE